MQDFKTSRSACTAPRLKVILCTSFLARLGAYSACVLWRDFACCWL